MLKLTLDSHTFQNIDILKMERNVFFEPTLSNLGNSRSILSCSSSKKSTYYEHILPKLVILISKSQIKLLLHIKPWFYTYEIYWDCRKNSIIQASIHMWLHFLFKNMISIYLLNQIALLALIRRMSTLQSFVILPRRIEGGGSMILKQNNNNQK